MTLAPWSVSNSQTRRQRVDGGWPGAGGKGRGGAVQGAPVSGTQDEQVLEPCPVTCVPGASDAALSAPFPKRVDLLGVLTTI